MTEQEWLGGRDYAAMYGVIRGRASTRKVRLYMVACCRLVSDMFFDARIGSALATAERIADDQEAEVVATDLWDRWITSSRPCLPQDGLEGELGRAITGVWQLVGEVPNEPTDDEPYSNADAAVAGAALMCLRDHPRETFTGGRGDAAYYCALAVDRARSFAHAASAGGERPLAADALHQTAMAGLLRDIFGNPFRPAAEPDWLTPTVVALAQAAYDEQELPNGHLDPARLSVLGDALEEAGADADLLAHLRDPRPHVRGCYVLDAIMGRR